MFVPGPIRPAISSPRRARLVRKLSSWGERGDRVAHAPAVRRLILPTASLPYVRMVRDICAPLPLHHHHHHPHPPIRHHHSHSLTPTSPISLPQFVLPFSVWEVAPTLRA